jgi:hypothetical protein
MCKVCFPFPPPTLHLRFTLSQKGNSVLQHPDNSSLLNNLKIHNFISLAVAPGVTMMTECGARGVFVRVQNGDGAA